MSYANDIYTQMNSAITAVDQELVNQTNSRPNAGKGADLDKEAFLKLLMAQIRYQDPLEPMDNSESIAQMAQFTTLEQLMAMNETMATYFSFQMSNSVMQYSTLIGKEISYIIPVQNEDGTITKDTGSSIVTGVSFIDGSVVLSLENGKIVDVGYVESIGKVLTEDANNPDAGEDENPEADADSGTTSPNVSTNSVGSSNVN